MSLLEAAPMLQGVKVVDLSSVIFGPYSTQILADFGAKVTKIESANGDTFRYSTKPARSKAMSAGHLSLNRGKKSVVLDLKKTADLEVIKAMIAEADIFIHNIRDKSIQKLGLGYEAVKAINAQIIYVHCVGFGSGGPYSELQAYDDAIQAAAGATGLLSQVDGNPQPRYIPAAIADKVAGLHAAYATLAAVIHKLRTGNGQLVEVPMFEAFTHFNLKEHLAGKTFDPPVGGAYYSRQIDPRRQPFPTKDGYIVIIPYTLDSWDGVYEMLGDPDFMQDERYATPRLRLKNLESLYGGVARLTPSKTSAEWCEILRAARIPCMPVRDIEDMLDDPHLQQTGFFTKREHPTEGSYYEMREPSTFSDWTPEPPEHAAAIGQHTDEILARYGKQE